jgi:transposase, IS5 family
MADRGQLSLAEALMSDKLGYNARLEGIASAVAWDRFEALLRPLAPEGPGRPPYDALLMLKALLLQQWYGLSDEAAEEALNDRMSFRRFCGLALEEASPDHTTICRFRERLREADLVERLFAEFERQLEAAGLILKRGTMVDATVVEAARTRPARGKEDEAGDKDAAFARRKGRPGSTYGYKAHVAVDQGSLLIRAASLTPANVNETSVADALIRFDEKAVYADKAYASRARRALLKRHGIKARILHKTWGGGPPLTASQKRHNRLIGPVRAAVETVFATLKRRMAYTRVRYVGLVKNEAHLILLALAYNIRRAAVLGP